MSKRTIVILVIFIALLSTITSLMGVFSNNVGTLSVTTSVFDQSVELYGKGIYKMNSVSVAAQGIASDWVTMLFGIPVLILSMLHYRRGSLKGYLLLIGIISYFLYTYMSYVFLWFYNPLFLLYVVLMSLTLFALGGLIFAFDFESFKRTIPVEKKLKGYAFVQWIVGGGIGFMWLGLIVPTTIKGTVPQVLEHYTTLVIQGMDLGIVVPLAIYSGYKLLRKETIGYFLTPIILTKGATMLLAIFAMIINMLINGVVVSPIQLVMIPSFFLLFTWALFQYFKIIIDN